MGSENDYIRFKSLDRMFALYRFQASFSKSHHILGLVQRTHASFHEASNVKLQLYANCLWLS